MQIAREAAVPALVLAGLAGVISWLVNWHYAVPVALLFLPVCWVYLARTPAIPSQPLALLSPVSGVVARADRITDPWLDRESVRVRVAIAFPGIGVVRSPTEGKVTDYWATDWPFDAGPAASRSRGSPNCYSVWIRTDEDDDVVFAMSSSRPISRLKLDVAPGERIGQGHRIAFVYFASWVDVLVPIGSRVAVERGATVRAGESVLAELVRD